MIMCDVFFYFLDTGNITLPEGIGGSNQYATLTLTFLFILIISDRAGYRPRNTETGIYELTVAEKIDAHGVKTTSAKL